MERGGIIKGYTVKLSSELVRKNMVFIILDTENPEILEGVDNIIEINRLSSTRYLIKMSVDDFDSIREIFQTKDIKVIEIMPVMESIKRDVKLKIKVPFKCDYCGKVIRDEPVIYKYKNKIYFFCCRTCLKAFKKSQSIT